jgi:DNA helicase-2/ATP-dependent DNA helicase PcrA
VTEPASPELNAPQAEAVQHTNGPLVVFAGAGSGKTRVITYRIANLIANERVPPYRIMAVTFTNKAAREMRSRLEKLVGEELARELWVGTFHAIGARLLRRFGTSVGVPPNFVIYDTQDQRTLVTRVLRELDLDEKRYPPRALLGRIMKEKQEGHGPEDMSLDSYLDETAAKVFTAYEKALAAAGAVDFEDLIGRTRKLLATGQEGARLRRRFDHVLVDEFQDTNFVQYDLLKLLTSESRNLCVVGDDDQSIYRWRGADRRNILGFRRDYPDAKVVKLEENYRSTKNIVAAALAVITPAAEREPKELFTNNDDGEPLGVVMARDEHDEAAWVARAITRAREEGTALREMAVFYRVHAQSRVLEEALRIARLPYRIVGGTKFFERAEIKDALAYLRILVNPKSDVDFVRVINTPARGIGGTTIERLQSFASARGFSMYEAVLRVDELDELGTAARKKLAALAELLKKLVAETKEKSPSDTLLHVLDLTGYTIALREDRSVENEARLENLGELVGSIRDYETEATAAGEEATLLGFLERVTLRSEQDEVDDTGSVTLMTVHAAKGLEFELVFMTGMEEDMFPYRSMSDSFDADDFEEERRLAYVAITRARKRLTLSFAQMRQVFGQTRYGRPSRFLEEIPPALLAQQATRPSTSPGGPSSSPLRSRYVDRDRATPSRPFSHPQARPERHWEPDEADAYRSDEAPDASSGGPVPFEEVVAARRASLQARAQTPRKSPTSETAEVGGRYVDRDFFDDGADEPSHGPASIRSGARVWHERFGEGKVLDARGAAPGNANPSVLATFPGWGEKRVLLRFLKWKT